MGIEHNVFIDGTKEGDFLTINGETTLIRKNFQWVPYEPGPTDRELFLEKIEDLKLPDYFEYDIRKIYLDGEVHSIFAEIKLK